ncbi:hypothetical protein BDW59DRAFT_159610 [Aspergillus cavernicola]|uniref:C2H2-type domain-containing protein n=1 Tax=Aspergillus cavernicola TaxID=176166 RepID=A0ABR4IL05_9EURO
MSSRRHRQDTPPSGQNVDLTTGVPQSASASAAYISQASPLPFHTAHIHSTTSSITGHPVIPDPSGYPHPESSMRFAPVPDIPNHATLLEYYMAENITSLDYQMLGQDTYPVTTNMNFFAGHGPMSATEGYGRPLRLPIDGNFVSRAEPKSTVQPRCRWHGCTYSGTFQRMHDLLRHVTAIPIAPGYEMCPILDCKRIFNRRDNLIEHLRRVHHMQQNH